MSGNENLDSESERSMQKLDGKIKIPELLAPAGNFEKMVTAIHYGANAVYLGGKNLSLRAVACNFDQNEILRSIKYAHAHGVKVYITVNVFANNRDFDGIEDYLTFLANAGADGLIIADPGILSIARHVVPNLPIHLSTQANVTNKFSVAFWAAQGIKRLNIARELGLHEIKEIRMATDIELEIFVHGALCISYSGRCMLSHYLTGRDANHGKCAHPCRYSYRIVEEKRPGEYFPIEEDDRGAYIFNSRDLCLINRLPEIISAGVDSIKIEGRMKSMGYVGNTVRIYRAALEWIKEQIALGADIKQVVLPDDFGREIRKTSTRGQTENFFDTPPSTKDMLYNRTHTVQDYAPVAIVRATNPLTVEMRNVLKTGEKVESLGDSLVPVSRTVKKMTAEDETLLQRANPGNRVIIETDPQLTTAQVHSILLKKLKQP
jgi:putative protease